MDLGAIGPGPPRTDMFPIAGRVLSLARKTGPLPPGAAEALGDSVAGLLNELLAADAAKLIDILGRRLPEQESVRVQDLVETVVSSVAAGDTTRARNAIGELVALDSSRADTLRADPATASIRAGVDRSLDPQAALASSELQPFSLARGASLEDNRSMDLGAIGPGPPPADLSPITGSVPSSAPKMGPLPSGAAEALGDSVATLLNELSPADVAKLIDIIGKPLPDQDSVRLQDLVQTVVSSAAAGDTTRALGAIGQLVALDPSRADTLRGDPAIASIRAAADQLLDRHATLARLDAEGRLAQAAQQLGASAPERLAGWDMRPGSLLEMAGRIFDSGGLGNYMRAATLAQVVIDGTCAPAVVNVPPAPVEFSPFESRGLAKPPRETVRPEALRASRRLSAALRSLWFRAPLLILLVSWLTLGVVGGLGSLVWRRFWLPTWPGSLVALAFQVWGIGFLVLVLFGFYARVRKVRF